VAKQDRPARLSRFVDRQGVLSNDQARNVGMRRMRWIACLWPGLPQLWTYGTWSALAVALGAGIVLDLLLLVSFGWSELISQNWRMSLWATFGVFWVAATGWSVRDCRRRAAGAHPNPSKDPFTQALDHYLRGDYYQAEHVLSGLLRRNLRDLEARLMLATLMRHTGRLDEAARQLETLVRFEGAGRWELEIHRERELLAEAKAREATAA
jgi:hypothetical protein